jgi:hypothetical protein
VTRDLARALPGIAAWLALAVAVSGPALAHWLQPEQVIAEVKSAASRSEYGVERAERSAEQPRLLVVSVQPRWSELEAARRQEAAERWRRHWREAVSSGVLAIVDVESQRSLVSFDASGRALLR